MNRLMSMIVASVLVAAVAARAAAGDLHGFQKDDILKITRSQRDSIETYHFRINSTQKALHESKSLDQNNNFVIKETAMSGAKRRSRSVRGPAEDKLVEDNTTTWNGEVYKVLYATRKSGYINSKPQEGVFTNHNGVLENAMLTDSTKGGGSPDFPYDIVVFLESAFCRLSEETEVIDGVECVVATISAGEAPVHRAWLDPDRGFAVVQKHTYNSADSTKIWYSVKNSDFRDCGNGLWLPARTERTSHLYKGPKEAWGTESFRRVYVADILQVNVDLPDDLFQVAFPEGTRVKDDIAGVQYVEGMEKEKIRDALDEIFDEFVELQVESNVVAPPVSASGEVDATITESPEVAGTDDNRENGSSPLVLRIIVLALAVILVGAAVSVVLLLRKRSRIR